MTVADDMKQDALAILLELGRPATWTQVASSYSTATAVATLTPTAYQVTCSPAIAKTQGYRPGDSAKEGTAVVYLSSQGLTFTPCVGDEALLDEAWTVVRVVTHSVQASPVLYECDVRRSAR